MKLSKLIAAYGDDKVQAQFLDQCATSLNMNKGVTKITFGTEQPIDFSGTKFLGIVVWLDRDRVKEIIAASKRSDGRHPEDNWTAEQHAAATSYLTTGEVKS